MAVVSVQVIIGEASPGHQPRGLADNLGGSAIGVPVNSVEHLAVTSF